MFALVPCFFSNYSFYLAFESVQTFFKDFTFWNFFGLRTSARKAFFNFSLLLNNKNVNHNPPDLKELEHLK